MATPRQYGVILVGRELDGPDSPVLRLLAPFTPAADYLYCTKRSVTHAAQIGEGGMGASGDTHTVCIM
jgi:hypothetical protein